MKAISGRNRIRVVESYVKGLSYAEISRRTGVSEGSVANIVTDLKSGKLELGFEEEVDGLMEPSKEPHGRGVGVAEATWCLSVIRCRRCPAPVPGPC